MVWCDVSRNCPAPYQANGSLGSCISRGGKRFVSFDWRLYLTRSGNCIYPTDLRKVFHTRCWPGNIGARTRETGKQETGTWSWFLADIQALPLTLECQFCSEHSKVSVVQLIGHQVHMEQVCPFGSTSHLLSSTLCSAFSHAQDFFIESN